mmetsp:Transcript_124612/g.265822  ORF Transcript_124612/g.265822 Transcript_124612/m.265822 type:complete len:231 (-) Transcript_124612:107-799(-)
MGVAGSVAASPLMGYLQSEFERVVNSTSTPKRKLHLHQIQQLQPPQDCPLDLRHMATLWKLDADHDGCVAFQELVDFAEFCNERRRIVGSLDFTAKLKAQCVVELWETIRQKPGEEFFANWVVDLVSQGEAFHTSSSSPGVKFMSRDTVITLWELMQPLQISSLIDQQGFLDMLQQIGENQGLMPLQTEELDDWVPIIVVQDWVKKFIGAYTSLFQELGLEPPRSSSQEA